jgi:hypothetical protein
MTRSIKAFAKGGIATVVIAAMSLSAATPAYAQYRDRDRRDGIDAGDVIAGALIIGGIAAIASAASRDRGDRYGRYDRDDRYDRGYAARDAVEQCVYAAEGTANRYSWGGRSKVTDVRNIDRKGDGYRVRGRIAVNQMGRDYRRGDDRYGRGWDNDYRGWNDRYRGYDSGRFTCEVRYGRVVDIDYSGIRGL